MILISNLPKVCELARDKRVLDVGGWFRPLNLATHVLDVQPYETRGTEPVDPGNAERFSASTWLIHDACLTPWPYPSDYFDFSFCSHTLEDLRDPIAVCRELMRVSRAGYIEMPSRAREIFCKQRLFSATSRRSASGITAGLSRSMATASASSSKTSASSPRRTTSSRAASSAGA
jgi:hypothetical protein